MRYFAYCRKSTEGEERQTLSIPAQIDEIKRLAASDRDIEIVAWFDERMSAKSPGRPIWAEAISRIEKGEAEGLIAWHPDRLARNPVDGGWVIHLLDRSILKDVKFCSYRFENSPEGKFMLNIMFGQSKYYVDNLSINVRRGLNKKIEMGWRPNMPPLGYKNDKDTGTIVPDPERFEILKRFWEMFLTGCYSVPTLRTLANDQWGFRTPVRKRSGGKPLSLSVYYRILNNPFYAGINVWHGEWRPGKHKAMVTLDQFERAQALLHRRLQTRPKRLEFAFTGLMRCSCGRAITAEFKTKPSGRHYTYYRCTRSGFPRCNQPPVREEVVERAIADRLRQIRPSQAAQAMTWNDLETRKLDAAKHQQDILRANESALQATRSELRALTDLRVRGILDDEEFMDRRAQLKRTEIKLESANATEPLNPLELAQSVEEFRKYAIFWFSEGSIAIKRLIARTVCLNPTLSNKKLSFEARFPFLVDPISPQFSQWSGLVHDVGTEITEDEKQFIANVAMLKAWFADSEATKAA